MRHFNLLSNGIQTGYSCTNSRGRKEFAINGVYDRSNDSRSFPLFILPRPNIVFMVSLNLLSISSFCSVDL